MPASQPKYPVTIELTSSAAQLFTPFPAKLISGTSFTLEVTVLDGNVAADLTGCSAVAKARPDGAVIGVATATLATGVISTNKITFDCDAGAIPDEWQAYATPKGVCVWFEVTGPGSIKWQREAYCQIIDGTHLGDADVNGTAVVEEQTGAFSLTAEMSGKEIFFDGGAITMPSLAKGTTIVLTNVSGSDSAAIVLSGGITAEHEFAGSVAGNAVRAKGTISITYRTTTHAFVRGSIV